MPHYIIKVENLGKKYRIRHQQDGQRYVTMRDVIAEKLTAPFRWFREGRATSSLLQTCSSMLSVSDSALPATDSELPASEDFWALRNLSFEVKQGEVVGIIGRNGAGKSTLLKILSRITEPTEGRVRLRGRVASLLEVGTGFHPELTGRENIYLNGAILGMTRTEIRKKFDEIVAFAEVEKFLDTPVKRYSSGMYVRLAFAVAAHLEPEILIVDEVLAVGDAQFQKKCLGKMSEVSRGGRTVLFVSHNMTAVRTLCRHALWLDRGAVVRNGNSEQVLGAYLSSSTSVLAEQVWLEPMLAPGNDYVRLHHVCVRPDTVGQRDPITISTPFVIEIEFWNFIEGAHLNVSVSVCNEYGAIVFSSAPLNETGLHGQPYPIGIVRSQCYVPGDLLNDGIHRLNLLIVKDESVILYSKEEVLIFDVQDKASRRGGWYGQWPGAVRPKLRWESSLVSQGLGN